MSASKRNELVQNALKVFYKGGFHAVGMDRIAKETGVSKTAIYKHFRTKEDLILATLRLRDELFRNRLMRRVEEIGDTPKECLLAVFDALEEWFDETGFQSCMFIKASSEYQDKSHPIHNISAEHKRILLKYIEAIAGQAGARDPAVLASQIIVLKEGAIVLAHLHAVEDVAQQAKLAAKVLIDAAIQD